MAFTDTYSETSPNASTLANTLGSVIAQGVKRALRERLAIDHYFLASEGADTKIGYHKKVTLTEQAADPSNVANTMILYTKEEAVDSKAAIYMIDEDGNVTQLTEGDDWIAGISGEIRLWSGSTGSIPTGWVICDGNNSTPNLQDKFVIGAGNTYAVDATGGAVNHIHTNDNHTHDHDHGSINSGTPTGNATGWNGAESSPNGNAHYHTVDLPNKTSGNPSALTMDSQSNLPPYHALAYMMKS